MQLNNCPQRSVIRLANLSHKLGAQEPDVLRAKELESLYSYLLVIIIILAQFKYYNIVIKVLFYAMYGLLVG